MRVAAAVPRVHIADAHRNAEGALKIMQDAFKEGVEIVVMPELSLVGYTCGDMVLQKKLLRDSEQALYHPSFCVKAVDTTGAGDTFAGYFITGIAEGMAVSDAMRLASAAAALAVSEKGAATSIPRRAAVEEAMKTLKVSEGSKRRDTLEAEIRKYIGMRYADASLSALARELGYSEVYTGEMVKKALGTGFSAAVRQKRLEVALTLLGETDMPIADIISDVGYENESFFRKAFKQEYGKTPSEYRRLVKNTKIIK